MMGHVVGLVIIAGILVLSAAGIGLAGLLFSLAWDYMWIRAKGAYSVGCLRHTAKIIHRRSMIRAAARRKGES